MNDLTVDPERLKIFRDGRVTGIFVRALGPDGKWGSFDIAVLTRASLLDWLFGRDDRFLTSVILGLLDHDHVLQ